MVSPAPWQYLMKIAVWGHIAADLLVSWTEHPETFSMVCNFITHLVETRTLEEGFSSSVPVSPPGNVWLRTWARELRFKSETSDLMLTFMCMWEQENGFHETEPVWILAHILVPSIMARDWSGALKKTKTKPNKGFLFLCSYFCVLQYLFPARVQSETVRYSKNICFLARPKVSGRYYPHIFLSGDHLSS